jgi:hypothetical protein
MTEKEQYIELLKLEDKLAFFNKYNEVELAPNDFDILKALYKVYFNKFQALNTTCSACIREILNVCISRFSALNKQYAKVVEATVEVKAAEEMKVESEVKQGTAKKKGNGK